MRISVLCIIISFSIYGQQESKELGITEDLFRRGYYAAASLHYLKLIKSDSGNPELNYRLGVCYMKSRSQKYKAVKYFQRAVASNVAVSGNNANNSSNKDAATSPAVPMITYKLLADAYYSADRFSDAMTTYEKFKKLWLESKNNDLALVDEVNWKIELCKMGKELVGLKELVTALVNTRFGKQNKIQNRENGAREINPEDGSSIKYSLNSESTQEKSNEDLAYFEESYIQADGVSLSTRAKKDTVTRFYEANIATSVDGHIILLYKDENGEGNLYVSALNGNNWSTPEKLSKPVNTKGWEPGEFISADGSEMYFSSDRKGGYGGKDIYRCVRMSNGEWSKASNLGPVINSAYDEEAPCIHPNKKTLFFSSNKYENLKTFEIFSTELTDTASWTVPVNVSYPTEKATSYNELVAGKSDLPAEGSKESVNNNENYVATFLNHEKISLTIIKGKIIDKEHKIPHNLEITVCDNETGVIMGTFRPADINGQYLFILPSEKNNNLNYEADGYLFYSANMNIGSSKDLFKVTNTVQLETVEPGAFVRLNNIFFDSAFATPNRASETELNAVFRFLQKHPGVGVEITSNIYSESNLDKLASLRADAIANYLIEKGIEKKRISAHGKCKDPAKQKHKKKEKAEELKFQTVELSIAELNRTKKK